MKKLTKTKKIILAIFGLLLGTILIHTFVSAISPRLAIVEGENNFLKEQNNNIPIIQAHQGGAGLYPSNTFLAFNEVLKNYGDIVKEIETDVRVTKDHQVLIWHDEDLRKKTNIEIVWPNASSYNISDYTYQELVDSIDFAYKFKDYEGNELDYDYYLSNNDYIPWIKEDSNGKNGYRISPMTLEEFFDNFANRFDSKIRFSIDIKDTGDLGKVASQEMDRLLSSSKYSNLRNRVVVASFSSANHQYFQANYDFLQSPAIKEMAGYFISVITFTDYLYNADIVTLQIPAEYEILFFKINLDIKLIVRAAHKRNVAVQYWTIDDAKTMKKLFELGADTICTNRPDIAKQALIDNGYL